MEKISFFNQNQEQLAARLELPEGPPLGFAIFAHCFTCNKNLSAVRNIGKALTDNGIAVFRFDFTGLGESEGDFANTNFSSNVEDLIAAANYLERYHEAPQILIGHSLGGAAVLFASAKLPSIKAVATLGAPAHPKHVSHLFGEYLHEIKKIGEAELVLGGRNFKIKQQFLEDIKNQKVEEVTKNLGASLMVMHSPIDETVGIENAALIYKTAKHPKNFISLDKADHLLSNKNDSIFVGTMIANWAKRYLIKL